MKHRNIMIVWLLIFAFTFSSCMSGEYEQVILTDWEEQQTFGLKAPSTAKAVQKIKSEDEIRLKLEGFFSRGDQLVAFRTANCIDHPIAQVSVVHTTHAYLNVPAQFQSNGELYFKNVRGSHFSECTKVKID